MLLSKTWRKISRLDFLIRKARRRLPIRAYRFLFARKEQVRSSVAVV